MSGNSSPFRLALISLPWAIFNRPSVQLGVLKSYLETNSEIEVDTFHPYLSVAKLITTDLYHQIALSGWAGEALFSPLVFPEKFASAESLYKESLGKKLSSSPSFQSLTDKLSSWADNFVSNKEWSNYNAVGFSICFSQLLPSILIAKKLKAAFPDLTLLAGGSSCSEAIGQSLIQEFDEFDYIIDGEGEIPLLRLCNYLAGKETSLSANIRTKQPPSANRSVLSPPTPCLDTVDINSLTPPSYDSYFKEMSQTFPGQPFIPVLPLEFSRGCWWNKCSFCNLNLQWSNYRFKKSESMVQETIHLLQKHESLHFCFTDNALPPKETELFIKTISTLPVDFDFFAEIRAVTDPSKLQLFYEGGLRSVQVGIEALSTTLLKKMNKGTSVIDNIAIMKLCSQFGIKMEGNLILEFPGSTRQERDETLTNLDFVLPFTPLETATFFLGHGSPIHSSPENFDIGAILEHPKNKKIFPKKILKQLTPIVYSYRGDRKEQTKLWKPIKQKIAEWHQFHTNRQQSGCENIQALRFRDGATFLIIRQERLNGPPLLHRLRGLSRKIYLFCTTPVTIEAILTEFPNLKEQSLRTFVLEMSEKKIMFIEEDKVLSLAVHAK